MADGNNRRFLAAPATYAAARIILVPTHEAAGSGIGFWSNDTDGPFDLSDAPSAGFGPKVVLLTTFTRRRKTAASRSTQRIPGRWVPYDPTVSRTVDVRATGPGYCVFTSGLGGCALAIGDRRSANTTFTHDARERNQLPNLGAHALSFREGDRGYADGRNVMAFFWWNGSQWNLGVSAPYDASGQSQTIGADTYPTAMQRAAVGAGAEDDADD